jgi:hypothetical protein
LISCTRPVENGLKEPSALFFSCRCSPCNRCRDEAASQLYPGQVVEVAALSSLHGCHFAKPLRARESAVV